MEQLSGTIIKGYELQDRIGAGGFGAVYRAYQSTVGREVAIKIILPGFANWPEFVRRFEAEAQTIEANALRPSVQIAEQLAIALNISEDEQLVFVRLARADPDPSPLPTSEPIPEEIGQADLSGRAVRGFDLSERIGTDGYGVVYRATQTTVGRDGPSKLKHRHKNLQHAFKDTIWDKNLAIS